jgi:hypothetical protein
MEIAVFFQPDCVENICFDGFFFTGSLKTSLYVRQIDELQWGFKGTTTIRAKLYANDEKSTKTATKNRFLNRPSTNVGAFLGHMRLKVAPCLVSPERM